ncbi:fibronectin type III domain-containing protein, partial [archaeon]
DLNSSLSGINLKWTYTGLSTIKEIALIYYKNASDADIASVEIASGLTKYNLSQGLDSGATYTFQLQVTDVLNAVVYSSALVLVAPYFLVAPVIQSVIGFDEALRVTLASSANILTTSDVVEFVLKREDNQPLWIFKPYASNGVYTLSRDDSDSLLNNTTYRIACMFQPASSNSRYSAPSAISNSILGTPSNTPNAARQVLVYTRGSETLDVEVQWLRPTDFSEWANEGFSIKVGITPHLSSDTTFVTLTSDLSSHLFSDLQRGTQYSCSVQYINQFGEGPVVNSVTTLPTSRPDSPILYNVEDGDGEATIYWQAPAFSGQAVIQEYRVYKDGVYVATTTPSTRNYKFTNLVNGQSYSLQVSAYNSKGESLKSSASSAAPYGAMSIVSVIASQKTLTVTVNPNGKPITRALLLALDSNPDDVLDGSFFLEVPQSQISQSQTSQVEIAKTFTGFSSNITFWCVIVYRENQVEFLKSV